jgi:hypothetical protein
MVELCSGFVEDLCSSATTVTEQGSNKTQKLFNQQLRVREGSYLGGARSS